MKPGPRVVKWLGQGLALGKSELEAGLGFPMTVWFLSPDASCYFPEASTKRQGREKWSEEKQREEVKGWLRDQMKKRKRSARLIGMGQRIDMTSRLQGVCKLAVSTPSESKILTISSSPLTWENLLASPPLLHPWASALIAPSEQISGHVVTDAWTWNG